MNQFLSFQIASWIIVLKSLKSHKLLSRTLSYKNIFSLLHATLEFKLTYWLKMVRWLKTANKKALISAFRWNCSYSINPQDGGSIRICDNEFKFLILKPDNAVPSTEHPPPIASQIELQTVDLLTLSKVGKPLYGHLGYTPSEKAFYLYADVSENFVGSGSEDGRGCLWERHFGSLVRFLGRAWSISEQHSTEEAFAFLTLQPQFESWHSRNLFKRRIKCSEKKCSLDPPPPPQKIF